jgi:hypothetical protein
VNKVFIETTVTVLPTCKPKDFVGTKTKWAIEQVTDWFTAAQQELVPSISLILLPFFMTSKSETEAIRNTKKLLNSTVNHVKKHVDQFQVTTTAASKGNTYQMYLKMHIGTNALGKDLNQMILDLKLVSSKVSVFKSTLQKSYMQVINWILNSH